MFACITTGIDDPEKRSVIGSYVYLDDHTLWAWCPALLQCGMIFSYNGDCLIRICDTALETEQAARELWAQFEFEMK